MADLGPKKIGSNYQKLLQISSSGEIADGSGSAVSLAITGNITASGDISGSSSTTGSFGRLDTADSIYASGRIYESGTSVIDHATAMAIVFGG